MADDNGEDEEAAPAVELGTGETVDGAPIARVAARLHWPIEKSEAARKEGDATIRTPEGPLELGDVLDDLEEPYFERRQDFERAVREAAGEGPVPTNE